MKYLFYIVFLFSLSATAQNKYSIVLGSSGSAVNKTPNWYNILDYGAVSDSAGSTNSYTAIQVAINAAHVKGGVVYMPAGYYASSPKVVTYRNVSIVGDEMNATFWRPLTSDTLVVMNNYDNAYANGYLWDIAATLLKNICLEGRSVGTVGFFADEAANFRIERVMIRNFTSKAMYLRNCLIGEINGCYLKGGQYGIVASATPSDATTLVKFNSTSFNLFTKTALDWSGGGKLKLNDCDFEGNGGSGDTTSGSVYYHDNKWPGGLHINGGWAEGNYGTVIRIENNVSVQSAVTLYPVTTTHSINGFQDVGNMYEFASRNVYLKGSNQNLDINASTFSGAAKSVVSDGTNNINYKGSVFNNGTTMRGGATITKSGN